MGKSVKTSSALPHQGVTIESQWVTELFHQWLQRVRPGAKVFSASKQQFEGRVRKVIFGFGLDDENAIFTGLDIPIAFSRSAVLPCSRAAQAAPCFRI